MCFSATLRQNPYKLADLFQARVVVTLYDELFKRRLLGEKIQLSRAMETPFVTGQRTPEQMAAGEKVFEWRGQQIEKVEIEMFAQAKRLADAQRKLETKITKKAQEDVRIATSKIEKFKKELSRLGQKDDPAATDDRIFPFNYISILTLDSRGEKIVIPVRYHMRPADKDESFDKERDGCYNARLDSLNTVPWWRNVLGKHHGVMLVRKFYENVPTAKYTKNFKLVGDQAARENLVICFQPDDTEYMFIPVLWDIWKKQGSATLYSAALITDEPAPEIALAGHDRTPIFLKETAVEKWLHGTGSYAEIVELLADRVQPHYSHQITGVA